MSLSKYEKETIINFNQLEKNASVYTCDEGWIKYLDGLCKKDSRVIVDSKDEYSKTYLLSKKAIKIILPRLLSEPERQKRAVQLKSNLAKAKKH